MTPTISFPRARTSFGGRSHIVVGWITACPQGELRCRRGLEKLRRQQRRARIPLQVLRVLGESADKEDWVSDVKGDGHERAVGITLRFQGQGAQGPGRDLGDQCSRALRVRGRRDTLRRTAAPARRVSVRLPALVATRIVSKEFSYPRELPPVPPRRIITAPGGLADRRWPRAHSVMFPGFKGLE
jgi:hypothetical protein